MTLDLTHATTPHAHTQAFIRDLPQMDRPRERLQAAGAGALSNPELLAILLRTGSQRESALAQAQSLIARFGGMSGLVRASFAELCAHHGIGEAKAAQIKAALELGIRMSSAAPEQRMRVQSPSDVAELMLAEMSLFDQEHVRVALLDLRLGLIGVVEVYIGSVEMVPIRCGELLRDAVRSNAPQIVVLHNHPSGDPMPSRADVDLTKRLVEAGRHLDIDVLDHLVIGGGQMMSMKHLRLGFPVDGSGASLPLPPR